MTLVYSLYILSSELLLAARSLPTRTQARARDSVGIIISCASTHIISGFVSFDAPEAAQLAIANTNGMQLPGGKRLKVSVKNAGQSGGRPY